MTISLIAAMSKNRVIGKNNDLPWHLPDDFAFFKNTTLGHHVIMGRKNYESLPPSFRPLPKRINIIITSQEKYHAPQCKVVNSIQKALEIAQKAGENEVFIIGGGDIYRLALPFASKVYLTEIDADIDGDVYFPELNKDIWHEMDRKFHEKDERHAFSFSFVIYARS